MTTAAARLLHHLDHLNETSKIGYDVYAELRDLVDDALNEARHDDNTNTKEAPCPATT